MKREIFVHEGESREICLVEDGRLCEYLRENPGERNGDAVYLGKVSRIMPGMDAAFVDIGQSRNGFLPLKEKSETFQQQKLQTGDRVLVQVKREAHGEKGAFLSRDISLIGETVILMPLNRYIGVSARITDKHAAGRLRMIGEQIAAGRFGLVLRNAALDLRPALIREEAESLFEAWEALRREAAVAPAPSRIRSADGVLDALLRDYRALGIDRLVTDGETGGLECASEHSETDPIAAGGYREQRDRALQRRVNLPGGGNLVIDECEALTVIDVNTAAFTGARGLERTVWQVNVEACPEIARQIRLRNLSGIIIVDMIDMAGEEDRTAVLQAMKEALLADRRKTILHGFTSLGLLEMTRKRLSPSLRETEGIRKDHT